MKSRPHSGLTSSRDAYVLPVFDNLLVYSPLRRISALLNRRALTDLRLAMQESADSEHVPTKLRELLEHLSRVPASVPEVSRGAIDPCFLGIIPSRECNLSCSYCNFASIDSPGRRLDVNVAMAAVDWMAQTMRERGRNTLEVHFFGGEPFYNPDVVDAVVHRTRLRAVQHGLVPRLEVSTNGVFGEERARMVGDYFDAVVLSFDGPREIHDRHRPFPRGESSHAVVSRTARLLSESPTELCFRACVSAESLQKIDEIVTFFCEDFRPAVIDIEPLQVTTESAEAGLTPPEPYEMARAFARASSTAATYGIPVVFGAAVLDTPRLSFCPVGKDAVILETDGRLASCYLPSNRWEEVGLDLSVGHVDGNGCVVIDPSRVSRIRVAAADKPRCSECFCRWTCAGGCHVARPEFSSSASYGNFCIQTRIISACALLDSIGCGELALKLVEDLDAMQRLALQSSDVLEERRA